MIEKLGDYKVSDALDFESIYLVDNSRASFLFNSITNAKNVFGNSIIEFFHPATGYNETAKNRLSSSTIMPVQYINSSILPLKIIDGNNEYLILNCIDPFYADDFAQMVSLAQKITQGWATKVYLLFSAYNEDVNGLDYRRVMLKLKDRKFVDKLVVGTFLPGFRNVN